MLPRVAADDWRPFALPMLVFLLLTTLEGAVAVSWYPAVYAAKVLSVATTLWWARPAWRAQFRVTTRAIPWGVLAGGVGYVVWIGLDLVTPHWAVLGTRTGFDPFAEISDPQFRAAFITLRLLGMVVLVPLMEEIFWRSFLLRYLTDSAQWAGLSLRTTSWRAGCATTGLFSLAHPEWLAALVFGAGMVLLCRRANDLTTCTVAHAVTNLCLAIHILFTGAWVYW